MDAICLARSYCFVTCLFLVTCSEHVHEYSDSDIDAATPDADEDAETTDADWRGLPCPPGMWPVSYGEMPLDTEYCVDDMEAHIDERGRAVSIKGMLPTTPVSWNQAVEACREAGKFLCPAVVWYFACGAGGNFPYGDLYMNSMCNDRDFGAGQLLASDATTECRSMNGAFSTVGNVAEWVDDCDDGETRVCMLCGGSYLTSSEEASCDACEWADANDGDLVGSGFRCCIEARVR